MNNKFLSCGKSQNITFDDKLSNVNKFINKVGYCGSVIAAILYFVCKIMMVKNGIKSQSLFFEGNILNAFIASLLLGIILIVGCVFYNHFVAFLIEKIYSKN